MLNAGNREVTVKHVLGALLGAVTLLGSAPSTAQTTLTIATVNNADMIRMQALTNDFTVKNPDVTVKWVTLEENVLRQRVTTDIATKGGQFDVLTIGTYEVPIWAKKNWLIPLDNLGPDYDTAELLPKIPDAVSGFRKLFSAPFYGARLLIMDWTRPVPARTAPSITWRCSPPANARCGSMPPLPPPS